MSKIEEAQEILRVIGMPPAQCNELSALVLLALCGIKEDDEWDQATRKSLRLTKGIMDFVNQEYGREYAPNSRETFRRQVLHQFVQGDVAYYNPDNPNLPVNSPNAHYSLSDELLSVVKAYNTENFAEEVNKFLKEVGALKNQYLKERVMNQIPVKLPNGEELRLSAGKHNELQAAIVEEFASRFTKKGKLLYLGDTEKKDLHVDDDSLRELGIPIDQHSKLPDVVILDTERNWLFLIEAVTTHGPVSPKRLLELEDFLKDCKIGKVYVTAFPDMTTFKKYTKDLAWETEVWLMEIPDHMIHFNGDRFLGPHKK